jgi:lysozyme
MDHRHRLYQRIGSGRRNARGITAGKTITREQNDRALAEAFAREYGPPVDAAMPGAKQHERDAGYSYCFNCGPGAMADQWVVIWRGGFKFEAGERLKRSRVTAGGKVLQGLVNRRAAEARLLVNGDYGAGAPATESLNDGYRRKLADLGYDTVLAFQKHHPNLINDGILGPATRAQIDRDMAATRESAGVGGGAAVGVGLAAWLMANGHLIGLTIAAAVGGAALWFVLRRREEITHWIRNLKG